MGHGEWCDNLSQQETATTRKGDPEYGKFSTNSIEKCDKVALMLYDEKGNVLLGYLVIDPSEMGTGATYVLSSKAFTSPDAEE